MPSDRVTGWPRRPLPRFGPPRVTLALALGLTLGLAACGEPKDPAPAAPAAARGERFQVRAVTVPDLKAVAATVETRDMAEARTRIGGVLTTLNVREGDMVRRGQVIGRVVDRSLDFQTSAMGAQAASAAAEASRAEADLARTTDLYRNGVYAKARLEQVQATAKAARGALAAAQAQRSASADLGRQGVILAPADGRVLKTDTPAGSVVSPGQSVATLTAGPPVLRLSVPESAARALRPGVRVVIAAEDLDGVTSGQVAQVYPAIAQGRVTADITVPGLRTDFVGRRVRVSLPLGDRSAVIVPRRFIATRFGVDYARIVGPDGAAGDVPVQLAPGPSPDQVEVLSGVAAGDTLVAPEVRS